MRGGINTQLIKNEICEKNRSACFFSGGVDAHTTLLRHFDEKPILLTLWGSDIKLDDLAGWDNVWRNTLDVAKEFHLDAISVKSEFRYILNEQNLTSLVRVSGDGWWHGFQHGIGLIGHAAPLVYAAGLHTLYIASSFSESMKGQITCASDPTIDSHMHFAGCHTVHDGYELNRQMKVAYILDRSKELNKNLLLRVCWKSSGGENCCCCEKCYRTILEIVSEGGDPNSYGFVWNSESIKRCSFDIQNVITTEDFFVKDFYVPIQKRLTENKNRIANFCEYKWLAEMNLSQFNDTPGKKWRRTVFYRGYRKIIRLMGREVK